MAEQQQREVDATLPLQEEAALSAATANASAGAAARVSARASAATATSSAKADTAPALAGASKTSHDATTTADEPGKAQAPSTTTSGNPNIPSTSTATPTPEANPTNRDGGGSSSIDNTEDPYKRTIRFVPAATDGPGSDAARPFGSLAYERTELAVVPPATPALPPHYVERSVLLRRAVNVLTRQTPPGALASPHGERGGHRLHVLLGSSGSGKTVLASSIVRNTRIRKEFKQGIFWVQAGCGSDGTNSGRFLALVRGLAAGVERDYGLTGANTDGEKGRSFAATADEVIRGRGPCSPRLACAEEAISQMAKVNGNTNHRRLVVLDDACDAGVVSELQRAGFVVVVTTTSAGALSLERGMGRDRRIEKLEVPSDMTHNEAVTLLKRRRRIIRQREGGGSDMEQRDAVDDIAGTTPAESRLLEVIECDNVCFVFAV